MKKIKKKLGRKLQGKKVKEVYSVRLEPKVYGKLVKRFGSFTEAIKELIKGG